MGFYEVMRAQERLDPLTPGFVRCPECHGEVAQRLCGGHMIAGARPQSDRCEQCWCWRCGREGEVEG